MKYDLKCKFDFQKHKETFINYLEVVILEDGTIEYAVPSHQEKMINIACKRLNCTRDELSNNCPISYYADWSTYLCKESKAVAVWNNFYMSYEMNEKQRNSLQKLKQFELYTGEI